MKNNSGEPHRYRETLVELIMYLPLFGHLNGPELEVVARHMNYFELEPGDILFHEGDPGDSVCFVVKGLLEVLKGSGGDQIAIAHVSKNRSIGEMSVIDNTPRSATVRAKEKTHIVSLTKKGFDDLLDQYPKVGIQVLKQIARLMSMNLRKTSSRLADYMLPMT